MGSKKYITLGLFFLIGLGCALFLAMFTKDLVQLLGEKKYIYVKFDNVAGLRSGDSVRVNGLELGRIDGLFLRQELGKIIVRIALYDQSLVFYTGYKIKIQESSLIGGRYLNIVPKPDPTDIPDPKKLGDAMGTNEAQPLEGSSDMPAFDKIPALMEKINWDKLSATFENLSEVLKKWQENSSQTIENVRDASKKAAEAFDTAQQIIKKVNEGPGLLGKLVNEDATQLFNDVKALASKARSVVESLDKGDTNMGKTMSDLSSLSASAKDVFDKINKNQGTLGALVNERELYDEMRRVAENLRDISSAVREKESALGRAVYDKEMGNELKDTIHEMHEMAMSLNRVSRKVDKGESTVGRLMNDDSLYQKADQALTNLNRTLGAAGNIKLFVDVEDKYYSESLMNIAKVHVSLYPRENKFLKIGVAQIHVDGQSDITTEDNQFGEDRSESFTKLDVQLGYKFLDNKLTLRGGLIEGKPGAGIDYDWTVPGLDHNVRFTFEGRGSYNHVDEQDLDEHINGPNYRLEASSKVLKYFRPYVGAARLGNEAEFFGGVTFEYEDEDIRNFVQLLSAAK
ncbi:MAG: MCE family protein [Planctomycetes bacterium]|nr:MCE family protein [Planctomycetota bacterium]